MLQTANINRNSQVTGCGVPVILTLKYKSASATEGYFVTSDRLRWLKARFHLHLRWHSTFLRAQTNATISSGYPRLPQAAGSPSRVSQDSVRMRTQSGQDP